MAAPATLHWHCWSLRIVKVQKRLDPPSDPVTYKVELHRSIRFDMWICSYPLFPFWDALPIGYELWQLWWSLESVPIRHFGTTCVKGGIPQPGHVRQLPQVTVDTTMPQWVQCTMRWFPDSDCGVWHWFDVRSSVDGPWGTETIWNPWDNEGRSMIFWVKPHTGGIGCGTMVPCFFMFFLQFFRVTADPKVAPRRWIRWIWSWRARHATSGNQSESTSKKGAEVLGEST